VQPATTTTESTNTKHPLLFSAQGNNRQIVMMTAIPKNKAKGTAADGS